MAVLTASIIFMVSAGLSVWSLREFLVDKKLVFRILGIAMVFCAFASFIYLALALILLGGFRM